MPPCECHILLRTGQVLDGSHGNRPCSDVSRIELCETHAHAEALRSRCARLEAALREIDAATGECYSAHDDNVPCESCAVRGIARAALEGK